MKIPSFGFPVLLFLGCNLPGGTSDWPTPEKPRPTVGHPGGTRPEWLVGLWHDSEKQDLTTRSTDTEIFQDGTFTLHHLWSTARVADYSRGVTGGQAAGNEFWRAGVWTYAQGKLILDFDLSKDRSEWPPPEDSPFGEPRWEIPVTLGRDPAGRTALISEGEVLCVKQR